MPLFVHLKWMVLLVSKVNMITVPEKPCMDAIVADLFRLARTGRYLAVDTLLDAAEDLHPNVLRCELELGCRMLRRVLWDNDYYGFRSELEEKAGGKLKLAGADIEPGVLDTEGSNHD